MNTQSPALHANVMNIRGRERREVFFAVGQNRVMQMKSLPSHAQHSLKQFCENRMAAANNGALHPQRRAMLQKSTVIELNYFIHESLTYNYALTDPYFSRAFCQTLLTSPLPDYLTIDHLIAIATLSATERHHLANTARVQCLQNGKDFGGNTGYGIYVTRTLDAEPDMILVDAAQVQQIIRTAMPAQLCSFYQGGYRINGPAGTTCVAQENVTDIRTGKVSNLTGIRIFFNLDTYGMVHDEPAIIYQSGLQRLDHLPENLREQKFIEAVSFSTTAQKLALCDRLELVDDPFKPDHVWKTIYHILESYANYELHIIPIMERKQTERELAHAF